ncbi:MAG: cyclic nucleotide-binding domain-containing protein [Kouleothrix sp.]
MNELLLSSQIKTTKHGIWIRIAAAILSAEQNGNFWHTLKHQLPPTAPVSRPFWQALATRIDPAQYCPQAIPDVAEEQIADGDQNLTVLRSPRGTYLNLTPPQRELWHQMDGTHTVAQLATQAFLRTKQLLPVGELVESLRTEGFLIEQPVGVYTLLASRIEARTPEGWGRRIIQRITRASWQFTTIDAFYNVLYRAGGWLLFTWVFVALWLAVALVGFGAFLALLLGYGQAPHVLNSAAVPAELVALWCALLVSFFLHESAHALTVKHFGRELRSGGAMLYFGMPAFFVDTSDIWRSPRAARILVSAAGPMADLFVGGAASLLVFLRPEALAAGIAYKLAFTCYIATLVNLNPLLELDGYYILVDWLRMPDLRRRALAFVRGPLWARLRRPISTKDRTNSSAFALPALSHEERLLTLYGALTACYALVAAWFALQFWNQKLLGTIRSLWATNLVLPRMIAALLVLVVLLPIVFAFVFALVGAGRSMLSWLLRRGYGRQPALLTALAGALAMLLAWLVWRSGAADGWAGMVAPLLWALALGALLTLLPDYRRAAIGTTLQAFAVMLLLAALSAIARYGLVPVNVRLVIDGVAFIFLLIAGFAALLDVDLRLSTPRELAGTAVLLLAAFGIGSAALLLAPLQSSMLGQVAVAVPAYCGALALALLLPRLFDLYDSRLIWSWVLIWCATLVYTAAYVADLSGRPSALGILAAGLWAGAWLVQLATLRQIMPDEVTWPHEPSMSDTQRLQRAFQFGYIGCYRLLRAVYGARRTRALDDRMDVLAATANWDVTLDRDRVRISPTVQALPLDVQGARYAEVLRYTVATIEEIAGATFARRAIQAAYDALPWPERETASRYCFPDTPWARELSQAFGDVRTSRLRLLRQSDQFLACDDDELAALAHVIEEQAVPAGTLLLQPGAYAPGIWMLEAGEVAIMHGEQLVAELHRGEVFGAAHLEGGEASHATYRTTIATNLLFIPAADFSTITQPTGAPSAARRDAAARLKLLEHVPMFAELPRNTLRGLANIARQQEFTARAVVVRQGFPSGVFYIIRQGRAAVLVRDTPTNDTPASVRRVAQLGPEEFFGELELLRNTPPVASVVALTPLVVLALPHAAIQALLAGDTRVAQGLEQIGTGRLIALRGTPEASA